MKKYIFAVILAVVLGVGAWSIFNSQNSSNVQPVPSGAQNGGAGNITGSGVPSVTTTTPPPVKAPSGPATYTISDVAGHSDQNSCWTVVNGSVYDLTKFIFMHPGGSGAILRMCGVDATASFENQHGGQSRPESELASLKIGILAK